MRTSHHSSPSLRARRIAALVALSCMAASWPARAGAQPPEQLPDRQLLLVREAMRVVNEVGDDLWNGWNKIPKSISAPLTLPVSFLRVECNEGAAHHPIRREQTPSGDHLP